MNCFSLTCFSDAHEAAVSTWERLEAIREDAYDWIDAVKKRNADDFQKKLDDWEEKLQAVREDRLAQRAEDRKKKRYEKWLEDKAQQERMRREEEERIRQKQNEEQWRAARDIKDVRLSLPFF